MRQEQCRDKDQRQGKGDVADEAELFARNLRCLVRQQVEDHRRPAGIAAPAASEDQRAEDLGDGIVDGRRFKDAGEQIVPKALDLHVFVADQTEIDQHIAAHRELYESPRVFPTGNIQCQSDRDTDADVGEVEQIEQIVHRQPQGDRNRLEYGENDQNGKIFLHITDPFRGFAPSL